MKEPANAYALALIILTMAFLHILEVDIGRALLTHVSNFNLFTVLMLIIFNSLMNRGDK